MSCPSCGSPGFDGTCPYCAGDFMGAVEAGQIDPDDYLEPTVEDMCDAHGHEEAGPGAGRCYCGAVRYDATIGQDLVDGLI